EISGIVGHAQVNVFNTNKNHITKCSFEQDFKKTTRSLLDPLVGCSPLKLSRKRSRISTISSSDSSRETSKERQPKVSAAEPKLGHCILTNEVQFNELQVATVDSSIARTKFFLGNCKITAGKMLSGGWLTRLQQLLQLKYIETWTWRPYLLRNKKEDICADPYWDLVEECKAERSSGQRFIRLLSNLPFYALMYSDEQANIIDALHYYKQPVIAHFNATGTLVQEIPDLEGFTRAYMYACAACEFLTNTHTADNLSDILSGYSKKVQVRLRNKQLFQRIEIDFGLALMYATLDVFGDGVKIMDYLNMCYMELCNQRQTFHVNFHVCRAHMLKTLMLELRVYFSKKSDVVHDLKYLLKKYLTSTTMGKALFYVTKIPSHSVLWLLPERLVPAKKLLFKSRHVLELFSQDVASNIADDSLRHNSTKPNAYHRKGSEIQSWNIRSCIQEHVSRCKDFLATLHKQTGNEGKKNAAALKIVKPTPTPNAKQVLTTTAENFMTPKRHSVKTQKRLLTSASFHNQQGMSVEEGWNRKGVQVAQPNGSSDTLKGLSFVPWEIRPKYMFTNSCALDNTLMFKFNHAKKHWMLNVTKYDKFVNAEQGRLSKQNVVFDMWYSEYEMVGKALNGILRVFEEVSKCPEHTVTTPLATGHNWEKTTGKIDMNAETKLRLCPHQGYRNRLVSQRMHYQQQYDPVPIVILSPTMDADSCEHATKFDDVPLQINVCQKLYKLAAASLFQKKSKSLLHSVSMGRRASSVQQPDK
ncbi:unnamed protein product, partial [Allacma fusca]